MREVKVRRTPDGNAYLHIWREGTVYESQKGLAFHREWTNIRFTLLPCASNEFINICDIRHRLPLPPNTFDAVNACHVVEHLTPDECKEFLSEILRVLRPGGILRISTPDLETACAEYLNCLRDGLAKATHKNIRRYRWAVLELIDQMVRDVSGGRMLETLNKGDFDVDYIKHRNGDVFSDFYTSSGNKVKREPPDAKSLIRKILSKTPAELLRAVRMKTRLFLLGRDPRKTREANKWLYDRLSLRLMLEEVGLGDILVKSFGDSDIDSWEKYDFDRSNHGDYALEPSLYMESRKALKQ